MHALLTRLTVLAIGVLAGWAILPAPVQAEDWMFNRSYYSHHVPAEIAAQYPRPESRSAYRKPYVGTQPGFAVRGGYRTRVMRMQSGNSYDTTIFREGWFDYRR